MSQENRKQLGSQAKAITALINGILYNNENTAVVVLSQTTTEITPTYTKQVPHGGKKVLFAASQVVKLASSGTEGQQIKGDLHVGNGLVLQEPIGRGVKALVEKNKLGRQSTTCEYDIYYAGDGVGVDVIGEIVKEAVKYQVIKQSKAWFKWASQEMQWQGESNTARYFRENPDSLELLKKEIAEVENS